MSQNIHRSSHCGFLSNTKLHMVKLGQMCATCIYLPAKKSSSAYTLHSYVTRFPLGIVMSKKRTQSSTFSNNRGCVTILSPGLGCRFWAGGSISTRVGGSYSGGKTLPWPLSPLSALWAYSPGGVLLAEVRAWVKPVGTWPEGGVCQRDGEDGMPSWHIHRHCGSGF